MSKSISPSMRAPAPEDKELAFLDRSLHRPRTLFSFCMSALCCVLSLAAAVPLFSVLFMLAWRGGARLSFALFTELPPAAGMEGGGIGNAIVGSLLVVLIASLMSIPMGILGGIFLAEVDPDGRSATVVRFGAKMLTGLPSILAGVFAYTAVVLLTGRFSPLAGGVALALLMLPIITLTTEESLRAVSPEMREGAIAMGATQTQLVWQILVPAAWPGISTGLLLALSRGAGETAPLLFTMTFSDYWLSRNPMEPTASLAVLIFNFSKSPFENQKAVAWAASFVLVVIVFALTVGGQALSRRATTMKSIA
jgi:phosphate transport system permease protein